MHTFLSPYTSNLLIIYEFIDLTICLPIHVSVCLSNYPFTYLSTPQITRLSIYLYTSIQIPPPPLPVPAPAHLRPHERECVSDRRGTQRLHQLHRQPSATVSCQLDGRSLTTHPSRPTRLQTHEARAWAWVEA